MANTYIDKWRAAADDVIAHMLVSPEAWEEAINLGVSVLELPGGPWQEVFTAIDELRAERLRDPGPVVLGDVEVAARCSPAVSVEWVADRIALADELRAATFASACKLVQVYGRGHRQLNTLQRGVGNLRDALDNAGDVDGIAERVVEGLRAEHPSDPLPVDIADISVAEEDRFHRPPEEGLRTGVWLLDNWLRGITPGEMVAFVAPYKSRKTSVLACVLLNVARAGRSATLFSYDESRARFYYRLMAVVMAEYMWHNHHWDLRAPDGTPLNVVDGKMIRNAGDRWLRWAEPLRLAREYARDELQALRGKLRVYDRQTAPATLPSIRARCYHDAMKYKGLDFIAVDHIQRLNVGETTYDRVEYGTAGLHELGGEMGAVTWVLSQQNEAAIRADDAGAWTPNAKGGGGLASNADTVLLSKYKMGDVIDPRYLRLELRLAREAEAPASGYVEIHPASGWITPRAVDVDQIKLNDVMERVTGKRPQADPAPLDLGGAW